MTPNHPVFIMPNRDYIDAGECKVGYHVFNCEESAPLLQGEYRFLDFVDCDSMYVRVTPVLFDRVREKLSPSEMQEVFGIKRRHDYNAYRKGKSARMRSWLRACEMAGVSSLDFYRDVLLVGTRSGCRMKPPFSLDGDFGWLLGVLATDGYIKRAQSEQRGETLRITFGNSDNEILDNFERIVTSYGLKCSRYWRKKDGTPFCEISVCCQPLVDVLIAFGMVVGAKSYSISCSPRMFTASTEVIGGYLAGCFDGDGNYSRCNNLFRLHSASWELMSSLAHLLASFGVRLRIYVESYEGDGKFDTSSDHGYSAHISGADNIERFLSLTSSYAVKEQHSDIGSIRCRRGSKEEEGDCIIETDIIEECRPTVNFSVERDNNFFVDNILTHNCGRAGRDGKDSLCITFYDYSDDYRTQMFLIDLTNASGVYIETFWDGIKRKAQKIAKPGDKKVEVKMTQKVMSAESGCVNVGGCIAFLKKKNLVKTLGRGKYEVTLEGSGDFSAADVNVLRQERIDKLNQVTSFYRSKECRAAYICAYFGDDTFEGSCGVCDNCS